MQNYSGLGYLGYTDTITCSIDYRIASNFCGVKNSLFLWAS